MSQSKLRVDPGAFDRAGLASVRDFDSPELREALGVLERVQDELASKGSSFRSASYKWPHDPLRTWSRVWEYPYTFHHIRRWLSEGPDRRVIVDLGSGVTFFPFALARLGCDVVCTDMDPICETDLARAIPLMPHAPGRVSFRRTDGKRLPFENGEADVVYCVSVLEHIPSFEDTVDEVARVLQRGGLFVLTFDLDLRGDFDLGPDAYLRLKRALARRFEPVVPEATVHPLDVLTSERGPYRLRPPRGLDLLKLTAKNGVKRALGIRQQPRLTFYLTVEAQVLRLR